MVSEQGNINIAAARKQEQLSSGIKHTDKGLLSRTTIITKHDHRYDLAQGSQLTANNTTLVANQGQIGLKAALLLPITMCTFRDKRLTLPQLKIAEKYMIFMPRKIRLNEFRRHWFYHWQSHSTTRLSR